VTRQWRRASSLRQRLHVPGLPPINSPVMTHAYISRSGPGVFPPPTVLLISRNLIRCVEPLNDERTMHGNRRVLARRGRVGEKGDFFSILLKPQVTHGESGKNENS
jgi:hypothetical protein